MHRKAILIAVVLVVGVIGLVVQQGGFLDPEIEEGPKTQESREQPIYKRLPGPPLCGDWYVRCGYQGNSKAVCEREYLACLRG